MREFKTIKGLSNTNSELFPPNKVIFERQMSPNDKSRTMSRYITASYLAWYHNSIDWQNVTDFVVEIPSHKKNMIHITEDLIYQNFAGKYASSYTGNKNHCKANLLYWCNIYNVSLQHLKKKNIDDAADAFMQAIAYIRGV